MQTKNYIFGCLEPGKRIGKKGSAVSAIEEASLPILNKKLYRANKFYNALIEIENERRLRWDESRKKHSPVILDLERQVTKFDEEIIQQKNSIKAGNIKAKSRKERPDTVQAKAKIAELSAAKKEVRAKLKQVRAEFNAALDAANAEFDKRKAYKLSLRYPNGETPGPSILEQINANVLTAMLREDWPQAWKDAKTIDKEALEKSKEANTVHFKDLIPGIKYLKTEAFAAAKKKKGMLKFKSFDYTGRLGAMFMESNKTLSTTQIFDCTNEKRPYFKHAQIDPLNVFESGKTNPYTKVRIRIAPETFVELPVKLNRKLPEGIIRAATLLVKRNGNRKIYQLMLTISSDKFPEPELNPTKDVIGVDIGWRSMKDDTNRVAVFSDPSEPDLVLPAKINSMFDQANDLQSKCDRCFNEVRSTLKLLMKAGAVPQDVCTELQYLPQFKTGKQLARIARNWQGRILSDEDAYKIWKAWMKDRFFGEPKKRDLFASYDEIGTWLNSHYGCTTDEALRVCVYLMFWRKKNAHLLQWGRDLERKAINSRNMLYNVRAKDLAKKYKKIAIENLKVKEAGFTVNEELTDRPVDEETNYHNNLKRVAPAQFQMALKKFKATVQVERAGTSEKHAKCGKHVKLTRFLMQRCEACNEDFDRDKNAAVNICMSAV